LARNLKPGLKKRWALRSNIRIGVFHETALSNRRRFFIAYSYYIVLNRTIKNPADGGIFSMCNLQKIIA
ncbi:TPA: hypothetical protein ACULBY_003711, partial [Escherichia coli]